MATRDIYLKIEVIPDYCPVEPDPHAGLPIRYRRDCMRNEGHEDGRIPADEVEARRLSALIYREYLDANYFVPKPDKIIAADVNEPSFMHRVPGTVIYARPGDRLRIHVKNADHEPHSFHVHGLRYGIDSDGSWPFGTQAIDGRRSDEICPGQHWTYVYDVTDEMVGAWPFHDHYRHIEHSVNRGLFGGIIVLPREGHDPPGPFPLPGRLTELIEHFKTDHLPGGRHIAHAGGGGGGHGHGGGAGHDHGGGGGHDHGGGGGGDDCPVCGMHGHVGRVAHCPVCAPQGHAHRPRVPPAFEGPLAALEEMMHAPRFHPLPRPPATVHVPLFFHLMSGARGTAVFRSERLRPGGTFSATFTQPAVYNYFCEVHGAGMAGILRVVAGGPPTASVTIVDNQYLAADVTVGTVGPGGVGGGMVTWTNAGPSEHTVTERGGASLPTPCFNGRAFIGNSPTITVTAGQKIRWYVFDLDFSMNWHNFHPHAQRWKFAHENVDIRSIGPAESFVVDSEAPPVLMLPPEILAQSDPAHRPRDAREYRLRGEFLFHCHVEMHMMQGLVGLLRTRQRVWLTPAQADHLRATVGLPLDPGPLDNSCPTVSLDRCAGTMEGRWELGPPQQRTMMHAVLMPNTDRVLYWGHGPYTDQTRIWDQSANAILSPVNQPANIHPEQNIWSGSQAYIDDANGTILIHAGVDFSGPPLPPANQDPEKIGFLFDPPSLTFSSAAHTAVRRFYPTTLALEDGRRHLALYGQDFPFGVTSDSYEVYTPGAGGGSWGPVRNAPFNYFYYPWGFILPGGDLFISGPQKPSRRFSVTANANWTASPMVASAQYDQVYDQRGSNMDGSAVLLPLRPPAYEPRVMLLGGSMFGQEKSAEWIDLSAATPAWSALPDMHERHTKVSAVLLPDGRVWVAGGAQDQAFMGPCEIFDPEDPGAGWLRGPSLTQRREYHSAAILLADGSVLMGGSEPEDPNRPLERYLPSYFFQPRPTISMAPPTVAHGGTFAVQTSQAPVISEVVLMRPGAVTHGFNMSQRYVGCTFSLVLAASSLQVTAPANGHIAPSGWYLLFILDNDRVPSLGRWIRLSP